VHTIAANSCGLTGIIAFMCCEEKHILIYSDTKNKNTTFVTFIFLNAYMLVLKNGNCLYMCRYRYT